VGVGRGQNKVLDCLEHVSTLGRRCSDRREHIPLERNSASLTTNLLSYTKKNNNTYGQRVRKGRKGGRGVGERK